MITAAQAKEQTIERLDTAAKEFITNIAEVAIQDAIDEGRFSATTTLDGIRIESEALGTAVVDVLQHNGFEADHIYNKNLGGEDNYILIKWEK